MSDDNKMGNNKNERLAGPDIVRTISCFFVVAAHFYLNVGYYNEPMIGTKMFVMTFFRWLFIACVPMFFMLTGYFKLNKTADKNHYKALVSLFISYIVISTGKMILYNYLYGKIYTFSDMLKNLGNYQIAWYMGMYLCLFLLIPFLNKMWGALNDKEKIILLITLVFLCGIYPIFNYIAPYYFYMIYPVMYYLIGAYIRQKQFDFNKIVMIAVALVMTLIEAIISFKFTRVGVFDWTVISTADGTYGTLFMAIVAVCIFLGLYKVDVKVKVVKKVLALIGSVSFEIYLFAGAYDAIIYQYLKRTVTGATNSFWWFFVTVPISFICAFISSLIFVRLVGYIKGLFSHNKANA